MGDPVLTTHDLVCQGSCVGDFCYSMCCLPCSISQMLREVRVRNTLAETQAFSGSNTWSSGTFACFEDIGSCCYAIWCPSCATASARSDYDGSNWCFNICAINVVVARNIIREGEYNLE